MGTDVEFLLEAGPREDGLGALRAAAGEVSRLERILSRFRPDSELRQLNRSGRMRVGSDLLALVVQALEQRDRTAGRFDPTVHDAVVAAGYDRSIESLPAEVQGRAPVPGGGDVAVDVEECLVSLASGVRLDLGGIAKGFTADRVADTLAGCGPCLVSLGGDIAVRGPRTSGPWTVGLATGNGPLTLALDSGAIATSGRDRRRWRCNGREAHHIIDPVTGAPSETDLLRVSVVASTGVEAEAHAKALMLAGRAEAAREADARGIPAVLVGVGGETTLTGGLHDA